MAPASTTTTTTSPATAARAICLLVVVVVVVVAVVVGPRPVAGQAPEPEGADQAAVAAAIDQAGGGAGNNNGTRASGGGGRSKLASSIDCQICEATCRVKCLINNLFQWGGCYQRCRSDNCNDWCTRQWPLNKVQEADVSICDEIFYSD
uniref:Uncharacterized protein n=1 Tax=Oryza punctata TaxID=4537 RepID=A0A0E0KDU8_ORYPU